MYVSFAAFFVSCLIVFVAEVLCFGRLRSRYPRLFDKLGKPSPFFLGIGSGALWYFITFSYVNDHEVSSERALFVFLSVAYIVAVIAFAFLVLNTV